MADQKENVWMAVPAFGDWDMKNGMPDYSMDFSKIRQMRKQSKIDFNRGSVGTDDELTAASTATDDSRRLQTETMPDVEAVRRDNHDNGRKKFMSYFQCCVGAA